jgi:hypothetical protein
MLLEEGQRIGLPIDATPFYDDTRQMEAAALIHSVTSTEAVYPRHSLLAAIRETLGDFFKSK